MATQSWTVDAGGVTRQIVVETDEAAQRTTIRVDGRMATRPLAAGEHERIFLIGSTAYRLDRVLDGTFDLDIAPLQYQPPPAPPPAVTMQRAQTATGAAKHTMTRVAPPKPRVPVFRIFLGIVVTVAAFFVVRYLNSAYTYMNVPWKEYIHEDKHFRVKFAGKPDRTMRYLTTEVGVLRTVQLKSKHAQHFYVVEFIDLPFVVPVEKEGPLQENVLKSMVGKDKLLTSDYSGPALNFIIEVSKKKEWSEGTARGKIIVEGKRIYIVYAFVPRGESIGWDVGEFLRSLEVA